ncbi:MAG: lactate racemase domain-containing protein [Chitinivibrionales bacterium]
MIYFERGSAEDSLSAEDLKQGLYTAFAVMGPIKKMLIVPPDITRLHSRAGELTRYAFEYNPAAVSGVLPALGTHYPMHEKEIEIMFGDLPKKLFRIHDWRSGCTQMGKIPTDFIKSISDGAVDYSIPVTIDNQLLSADLDCILSIGQIVPHEVAGMAGHAKNLFVGLGGQENIHKSHFLGAVYGIERIMGRIDSPVRKVIDYAFDKYLNSLPVVHAITVIGKDNAGASHVRGLFVGSGKECYTRAAELSYKVNIQVLDEPLKKAVVYLDPVEYKSFWLGNKSIYRTRMAIADKGELIVLAPGVAAFGEDREIDALIRKYGYKGTPAVMKNVTENQDLKNILSAAAHLIHGSTEGRFSVTYCTGGLGRNDVQRAGFRFAPIERMLKHYDPSVLREGPNTLADGEQIYFISNPGSGLWADKARFEMT